MRNSAEVSDTLGPAHSSRQPLKIVPHAIVELTESDQRALDELADDLTKKEPTLAGFTWLDPLVTMGMGEGPWLVIGDLREVALAKGPAAALYEYRLAMLARDGDHLVLSTECHEAFERYRESVLQLGRLVTLTVRPSNISDLTPLAVRCRHDEQIMTRLINLASRAGQLTLVPHINTGNISLLAADIARAAKVPVYVAAPPPKLARSVNDKVWFARVVESLLGAQALPPVSSAYSSSAMAARVRQLAQVSDRVVVKVPNSAGSAGNLVFMSDQLKGLPLREIRDKLIHALQLCGWDATYPLLVQIWETAVLASPSVQIWVPNWADGLPIVEGIFEQMLEGAAGTFAGSCPAELPPQIIQRLVQEATLLARLCQRLGYFGRISFDAIVAGQTHDAAQLHWIECNGRWGGVSIPMSLVNRLTGDWAKHPFVVAQREGLRLPHRSFNQILDLLSGLLFGQRSSLGGLVIMTPQAIESGQGYHLVAIADDLSEARDLMAEAVSRLCASPEIEPQ